LKGVMNASFDGWSIPSAARDCRKFRSNVVAPRDVGSDMKTTVRRCMR
jgi:hypothetical protein